MNLGFKRWMNLNRRPTAFPLPDTEDFVDLKRRFGELKNSVESVLIEVFNDGIQVSAENDEDNGFEFMCKGAPGNFTAHYRLINGGRADQYHIFHNREGNFIIEAARALHAFFLEVDENTVIRRFTLSIDGITDENGELTPARTMIGSYKFVKYNFLMHLEIHCLMKMRPRKIEKVCMEIRGGWWSRQDVWAVLPYIELVGEKMVSFAPSESRFNTVPELMLDRMYMIPDDCQPEIFIVADGFWTEVNCEKWAKYKIVRTSCKQLSVDTAKALVQHFSQSAIFQSCTIRLLEDNPDIRAAYNEIYVPLVPPRTEDKDEWSVPNTPFTVGISGDEYFFEKVGE